MREYEKPVAVISDGASEGVFAASGGGSDIPTKNMQRGNENIWNGNSGEVEYTLEIPDSVMNKAKNIYVTFDQPLNGAYGDGALKIGCGGNVVTIAPNWPQTYEQSSYNIKIQSNEAKTIKVKTITVEDIPKN